VGTVYEPEVAAKAIVFAATHHRREIYVGLPSAVTIIANKLFPGVLDRLMAKQAYEQQFTDEAIPADRPDNLFHAVPSPYRAHGSFGQRAHASSPQLWTSLHRDAIGAALAFGGLCALALAMRPRRQR
jgi:hypothetical protein